MYSTVYKSIIFIEGEHPDAKIIRPVEFKIRGMFTDSQLKTLDDVKEGMYTQALDEKANCITNFKYGQRSTFFGSFFNRDDVEWYGTGNIAVIPETVYQGIVDKKVRKE